MDGQIDIFEYFKLNPCDDCVFYKGRCTHKQDELGYCENGSFQIQRRKALCPDCGKPMIINQSPFGSDGGYCSNGGIGVVFNNQGNRMGWLEAWRKGLVETTD